MSSRLPKRIAILVACHDDGATLPETIESLSGETGTELVVIDDGSTDPVTLEVLEAIERSGVHVLRQENAGPASAWMTGVHATSAPYLLPFSSDDILVPGATALLADALDASLVAAAAWGDMQSFGSAEAYIPSAPELCPWHVTYVNARPGIAAFRREALVEVGGWQLRRGIEDWDLWMRLAARGFSGVHVPHVIFYYRRDHGGRFLSDDMTVVDAHGNAVCFPKPLTISAHTLRAVNATDLTSKEWRRLQWQSRLHSKGGRSVGSRLADMNLPIMALNAVTQAIVPPPKYMVDRLVPCEFAASTRVRELFVIERGPYAMEELDHDRAIDIMLENTDDAYGFPPFRYFAPAIAIGGEDYVRLRERERELVAKFLADVRVRRLARDDFSWADAIPELVATREDAWFDQGWTA